MTLGERIRKYRKLNKLSQQEFGNLVGVTGAYIQQLEVGIKSNPSYAVYTLINRIIREYKPKNEIEAIKLVNIDLTGITPSDEYVKVQEENKEFDEAVYECLYNPIEENKLHAIEEFWDKVQSSLSYLQLTLGIKADDVMEQYHLHLEKLKNRPR